VSAFDTLFDTLAESGTKKTNIPSNLTGIGERPYKQTITLISKKEIQISRYKYLIKGYKDLLIILTLQNKEK